MVKKPKPKTAESPSDLGQVLGDSMQFADDLEAQFVAKLRMRESGIPPKYMGKTLEDFKGRDGKRKTLRESAEKFIQSFNLESRTKHLGLFFAATTGAGKTHLATAILKGVIEKGYTGAYCNVPTLLEMLREQMADRAHYDDGGLIDRCESADLLVLDDIGVETITGWVQDRLYLLINRRYETMARTIVTTNCTEDELLKRVGQRVASRLIEMCPNRWVFPNEDYRMKALRMQ